MENKNAVPIQSPEFKSDAKISNEVTLKNKLKNKKLKKLEDTNNNKTMGL